MSRYPVNRERVDNENVLITSDRDDPIHFSLGQSFGNKVEELARFEEKYGVRLQDDLNN